MSDGALGNALSQLDGEAGTGAERAALQLTNQFLALMLDPFVNGRGGVGSGSAAIGFAPYEQTNLPPDIALAYASILTKASPSHPSPRRRWRVRVADVRAALDRLGLDFRRQQHDKR